jgi:hypothetical protein
MLALYNQLAQNLREYQTMAASSDHEPTDIGYYNLY